MSLPAPEPGWIQDYADSIVEWAQIVLACATGDTNTAVAKRFGVCGATVGKWR